MLNTFDALASFPANENSEPNDAPQNDNNASVDISAIINRLNEMETRINELVNKTTDFPTRGKIDSDNAKDDNPAPSSADNAEGE